MFVLYEENSDQGQQLPHMSLAVQASKRDAGKPLCVLFYSQTQDQMRRVRIDGVAGLQRDMQAHTGVSQRASNLRLSRLCVHRLHLRAYDANKRSF